MAITTLSSSNLVSQIVSQRAQMEALQVQLTTQKKSTTYSGLGVQRGASVNYRQQMSNLGAYDSTIDLVSTRLKLIDTSLTRLEKIPSEVKSAIDPNAFEVLADGKTAAQKSAEIALKETIGLLNQDAAGRYLFAGNETDSEPVAGYDELINGTNTKAGFSTYVEERKQADLGADGLGRLAASAAGTTVTLEKATPVTTTFGFVITGVDSDLSNVTAAVSGSPAALTVDFAGQPTEGESIDVTLTNPDGSTSVVTLTATAGPDVEDGQFLIGATPADTANNFVTSLTNGVKDAASTDLAAASVLTAADNFFDTEGGALPQRVDTSGGPAYTATDLVDADPNTSVIWYTGQNDASSARQGATAKIDSAITINYGVRANEQSLTAIVKTLAAFTVETFDENVATDERRYSTLAEKVDSTLGFPDGAQSPEDLHAEIAVAYAAVQAADQRHVTTKAALQDLVDNVEGVDVYEVSAQILQLQTQLQASYQTTALMSQLSLVNYL
ncbi:flagellar hook-associated protein FlgL [Hartmannibacter diazotrophicus]|uniref:Flagellar hook-associated protein FlgL n=1 Tax=Hartmannibacter diazotrophicus TaxID=1482074 RepID=A0A2C9D7D7_9HYPH|nr:flagellin [Hartmannibacter diazotrophicus]SON56232.1 flagellar hook-associated protein FlgL [Hartmannibacter diazotrophicus]